MQPKRKLRALGLTCGIGSMLVGARNAGFNVVGNIEWRKYYHAKDEQGRNTFLDNFKGAYMVSSIDEAPDTRDIDIALGHPECGNFSNLNSNKAAHHDPCDIPLFVDMVSKIKPRFFVMDDLPKSFIAFPIEEYVRRLPEYDLFPEWISNHGYGNVQKQRKRMFMIGALKTEKFVFKPGEFRHEKTVKDVIGDLLGKEGSKKIPNHDKHTLEELCAKALHLRFRGDRATWGDMRDVVLNEMREGAPISYYGEDGVQRLRIGSYRGHWEGPAHVLTGGISGFHSVRGDAYSIRERARMQGFPDDFIFYGVRLNEKGHWNHDHNMHMVKQTGKAMPVQFCEYVSRQIMAHIQGKRFKGTMERVLPPDDYIDRSKMMICEKFKGYSDQIGACTVCSANLRCPKSLYVSKETQNETRKEEERQRQRADRIERSIERTERSPRKAPEERTSPERKVVAKNW